MEEFEPVRPPQSYLHWYFESLGLPTLLLIAAVTLLAMALVVALFLRGRGPAVPGAILFLLPLPLIVGLVALLGGSITYLTQLANAGDQPVSPKAFSYALTAAVQASSCFCPLLILSLVVLMVLGFRGSKSSS
jgi:hypothetical protein